MSLRDQIVTLEALAAIDADLRRLEDQLTEERATLANMKGELRKLDEKLLTDRASLGDMERTRSELSTEVRQMTTQIERSREKLHAVRIGILVCKVNLKSVTALCDGAQCMQTRCERETG